MPHSPLEDHPDCLDIAAAAAQLGLSIDNVRKRLQRGKLHGFKAEDGSWRVVLSTLDINAAAAHLGLTIEAVRKRLQRGQLQGIKAADGSWRVVLPAPGQSSPEPAETGQADEKPKDHKPDTSDNSSALVAALRDEVTFLRSQLQVRDEEIQRAHVLLQQAQQQAAALLPGVLLPAPRAPWWRRWLRRGG